MAYIAWNVDPNHIPPAQVLEQHGVVVRGDGYTRREVAALFGISSERVRQIEAARE